MSTKTTNKAAVEVLPPQHPLSWNSRNQHLDTRKLDQIKQHITAEFGAYYEMEREAAKRAVRMGLMLKSAKEMLPHGAFMGWCTDNIPIKDRQINKFMKLAEFFLQHAQIPRGEMLLLGDGGEQEPTKEAQRAEQLLLDFVGDKSQNELFAQYGVGGSRVGAIQKRLRDMTPEERMHARREQAISEFDVCFRTLNSLCIRERQYMELGAAQLEAWLALFERVGGEMREFMKRKSEGRRPKSEGRGQI